MRRKALISGALAVLLCLAGLPAAAAQGSSERGLDALAAAIVTHDANCIAGAGAAEFVIPAGVYNDNAYTSDCADRDLVLIADGTVTIIEPVDIDAPRLTLKRVGDDTGSGGFVFRDITDDYALRAKGITGEYLTFENVGGPDSTVGALRARDATTIRHSTFQGNQGHSGGAIFASGPALTIDNSTFTNNTARDLGGAIVALTDRVWIVDSTLTSNQASSGGALYFEPQTAPEEFDPALIIDDSTFQTNAAAASIAFNRGLSGPPGFGGAIYVRPGIDIRTNMQLTTFTGNTAQNGGGAIHAQSASVYVGSSTFDSNQALSGDGGGAILAKEANLARSTFVDNQARNGGAAYTYFDQVIYDSTFAGNVAKNFSPPGDDAGLGGKIIGAGGAVFAGSGVDADNSTFTENSAVVGGAINSEETLSLNFATLVDNEATQSGSAASAGGIFIGPVLENSPVTISRSVVMGDPNGAAVCSFGSGVPTNTVESVGDVSCGAQPAAFIGLFSPLGDHGGPTPTLMPRSDELIGTISCSDDAATRGFFVQRDQRGLPRDYPGQCTPGAVEPQREFVDVTVTAELLTNEFTVDLGDQLPTVGVRLNDGPAACSENQVVVFDANPGVAVVPLLAFESFYDPPCFYSFRLNRPDGPGDFESSGDFAALRLGDTGVSVAVVGLLSVAPVPPPPVEPPIEPPDPVEPPIELPPTPVGSELKCAGKTVTVNLALGQTPTAGDDVILGTNGNDTINALGGNDTICSLAGNDTIRGGNGNDRIIGGNGNDKLNGGNGQDQLKGGPGPDTLNGNKGKDKLNGGNGQDQLKGGPGPDTLNGAKGKDTLKGGPGNDTLKGGPGNDTCTGGPGTDNITPSCEN